MSAPAAAKRGLPVKEDFQAWYSFIVEVADLIDKRYPIKGMDVWRPYGWKAMGLIDAITRREMAATDHHEVNFPLLIPSSLLERESRLVARLKTAREAGVDPSEMRQHEEEGFISEVYWVDRAGASELDEPLFIRPTSETAMYTMFPLWIRSHADLPLKIYQIVNTFRVDTKQTRSFLRVREIHFFEAHTAHADEDDATRQIAEDLDVVATLMEALCLPYVANRRPPWDTFPGAWYTNAIDVIFPTGRAVQVATVHHYRDQWAQVFDITYEDLAGEQQHVFQTTYGMSERLLGAVVGVHGDDAGLIFPPAVAPVQVVVIPIVRKERVDDVKAAAAEVAARLRTAGLRVELDDRDRNPGQKYYDHEIRGVPLRLEIGPRDLDSQQVFAARRTGGKQAIGFDGIEAGVQALLDEVAAELLARATEARESRLRPLPAVDTSGGEEAWSLAGPIEDGLVYELAFDGTDADAERIEGVTGLSWLGDCLEPYESGRVCAITGRGTTRRVLMAKTY